MPFSPARPFASCFVTFRRYGRTLACFGLSGLLGLGLGPVPARAARAAVLPGPAFDCRKASSETEKAICASVELGRLDRQQQQAWKAMNSALQEHPQHAALKQDQLAWLKQRDRCASDVACIGEAYRLRLRQLQGRSGDGVASWVGVFEKSGIGSLAIYPVLPQQTATTTAPTRYRISLQTAEPKTARWTCEWQGEAELLPLPSSSLSPGRLRLLLATAPASAEVTVQAHADGSMEIANDAATQAAAETLCGNGGSFAFRYRRVSEDR